MASGAAPFPSVWIVLPWKRVTGLGNVEYHYTGGVDGGRGWKGDVKTMLLSIEKLERLGWEPRYSSEESIEMTARDVFRDVLGELG